MKFIGWILLAGVALLCMHLINPDPQYWHTMAEAVVVGWAVFVFMGKKNDA